jgi:hypothetical protein
MIAQGIEAGTVETQGGSMRSTKARSQSDAPVISDIGENNHPGVNRAWAKWNLERA